MLFLILWWFTQQAAAAPGAPGPVSAPLRLRPLHGRMGASAGRQHRLSASGRLADHGHAADDADDLRRRHHHDLRLPAQCPERQFERSQGANAAVSRIFCATSASTGAAKERPHRHRHAERIRPSDALRPERRIPAGDHQAAAFAIHHLRAALVPARRHQRPLPARARREHLGRVGRSSTATWVRSTASNGAAGRRRTAEHRPARR